MKNYCGIEAHECGCACTKEAQLLMERQMKESPIPVQPQPIPEDPFKELRNIDYTIRRKVIYKGKMAPTGHLYIVVNCKGAKSKFEAHQLIKCNQSVEYEIEISKALRELIRKKYHE